jgi:formamidopyrimidine-DNA glycosylase
MPELPEVETIARQLNTVLPGRAITGIEGLELDVSNCAVLSVGRKQKIIEIVLDKGSELLVHLKMTGQLIFLGADQQRVVGGHPTADWVGSLPSKHTRATISFQDGSRLYFNDQRKFGWMKLVDSDQWSVMKAKMPPDVVDEAFTPKYLQMVLSKSSRAVKLVILDQAKIGGMGNIYANDALFMAKIHPEMPSNQLKIDAVNNLYEAMKFVINKGIETGGASYSHFVGIEGVGGHYQDHFLIYDKEGEPCKTCGTIICKIQLGGRGTYYCYKCQRRRVWQ